MRFGSDDSKPTTPDGWAGHHARGSLKLAPAEPPTEGQPQTLRDDQLEAQEPHHGRSSSPKKDFPGKTHQQRTAERREFG